MRSNDRTFTEHARRTQIILAAIEVIAEIGYAQASIRKIAERVGVAMSVVLYHFANKDELVREIINHAWTAAVDAIVPALEMERTAAARLRAYILANADFIKTNRMQYAAVLDIGLSYRTADGELMDRLEMRPDLVAGLAKLDLAAILREGQDAGEFGDFDPARTAMAIRGALNGAVLDLVRDPDFDMDGYGEELVALFERATRRG
ncbi:TetR/AcrR family transcriptional regulator [Kutzneria sp. CA-103260]|uniref:TetR/AcrR family transcriptional regulator n=1 Tax=Kutzneria sp. CA-103260 TaxID=2802641 RepID=UPI001BA727D1|nr:TetR/AcrR family transcriptional regulator [Kutzneria sp. CA-103260]QUQ66021.1 TetR family transcriptional regulator [Kutzneria sp. CA-103260]